MISLMVMSLELQKNGELPFTETIKYENGKQINSDTNGDSLKRKADEPGHPARCIKR